MAKFLQQQGRQNVILTTKVAGRNDKMTWLPRAQPETPACLTKEQIVYSVQQSLQRLETDYIDLLLLHWPDRHVPIFGSPDWSPIDYEQAPEPVPFTEQLAGLQHVVQAGMVRYVGVSNETPYGKFSMSHVDLVLLENVILCDAPVPYHRYILFLPFPIL